MPPPERVGFLALRADWTKGLPDSARTSPRTMGCRAIQLVAPIKSTARGRDGRKRAARRTRNRRDRERLVGDPYGARDRSPPGEPGRQADRGAEEERTPAASPAR